MEFVLVVFLTLVSVVVMGGFVSLIIFLHRNEARKELQRDQLFADWCSVRGWGFLRQWPEMVRRFRGEPFGIGRRRAAKRGFWGVFDKVGAFGFDYNYTVGSGKSERTVEKVILGIQFPGARFPFLRLSREGLFNSNDIQFENEEFNRTWRVVGPSRRFALDVVHPRAMHFLMSELSFFENLWLENDALMMSIPGKVPTHFVDQHLRFLTQFAGLIPSFVIREVGGNQSVSPDLSGPGISWEDQHRRIAQLHADRQEFRDSGRA